MMEKRYKLFLQYTQEWDSMWMIIGPGKDFNRTAPRLPGSNMSFKSYQEALKSLGVAERAYQAGYEAAKKEIRDCLEV